MNKDLKFLENRVSKLVQTKKELKKEFKKTNNPILEDLYLEMECYCREMFHRINMLDCELEKSNKLKGGNYGKNRKRRNKGFEE